MVCRILLSLVFLTQVLPGLGQPTRTVKKPFLLRTVAFYNLENLFDTVNDSLAHDDEHTPGGSYGWTDKRLERKLDNLARVLGEIGQEHGANPPDLIGVCEVENIVLLERLVKRRPLFNYPYGIIHFDSPDPRGIDVALIYRKDRFFPLDQQSFRLILHNANGRRKYTRDQLVVAGFLDQDPVFLLINHWPSRGGNAPLNREYRKEAALLQRRLIDSIFLRNPDAKIISAGDFNDNPRDPSLKILKGKQGAEARDKRLFNPMEAFYRSGVGSLAYRDRWNLFDQILFSRAWTAPKPNTYRFWKAGVYEPDYLKNEDGRFQGYPYRTHAGGQYQGGYSDHFPVYAYLIRPAWKEAN